MLFTLHTLHSHRTVFRCVWLPRPRALTGSERGRVARFARNGSEPVGNATLGDVSLVMAMDIAVDAAIPPPEQDGPAALQLVAPGVIVRVIEAAAHLLHLLIVCIGDWWSSSPQK